MMEMSLTVGNDSTEPLEMAVLINSIAGLARCIFFIIVAIGIVRYIKKKNADHGNDKHS